MGSGQDQTRDQTRIKLETPASAVGLVTDPATGPGVFIVFGQGFVIWVVKWENLALFYVNNKGADQPVHPCSLISAFVISSQQRLISKLAS